MLKKNAAEKASNLIEPECPLRPNNRHSSIVESRPVWLADQDKIEHSLVLKVPVR